MKYFYNFFDSPGIHESERLLDGKFDSESEVLNI